MNKRLFDIIFSIIAICLISPVLIIVPVLIKLDSSGGTLFKQERVGLSENPFFIYKFRSMVKNANKQGSYQTQINDMRITKIGKLLRKTSIDELPQLFNVLKGDMSIVGPRPNVFAQKELYTESEWQKRNSVLPGITGLAQALIRSSGSPNERTRLDLKYIDKQTVFYDMYIIALTVKQVLFKGNTN
ncbi:sugar transferase [Bathymodiolus thermophilus thioautotrophic gill symbiont]|uniref:Sugar transferase n=1 Tax=Bathymodiolus thermophilus thioautotrophic gill symbiont TaxID=2360 RepID=A0A1J5UB63_9GAMM|nr:sugar transferase [Bathymodiolus thermophilus thioautotrophic gill symbiont]OIR25617.1 sugar transferase [Bathymodiolus thermophilus thioautotrophic gill symbiont]